MKIFKYKVNHGVSEIDIPEGSEILRVGCQDSNVFIWVLVDEWGKPEKRTFRIIGTGWDVPKGLSYIGTCNCGPFVWHVFEEKL